MVVMLLFLLLYDKVLVLCLMDGKKCVFEVIELQDNQVIIVGFGCFGQIVGCMFYSQGYSVIVFDYDLDQIDMLCCFGFKVFYGDVMCMDLLEIVGVDKVSMMVVVIDDMEINLEVVDCVCECFLYLKLYVWVCNVLYVY